MVYTPGQTVALTVAFTDATGAAANPTTVTCTVEAPDGTQTDYTSASTPAITNTATGAYQLIIGVTQAGLYEARWLGVTGTTSAVIERRFIVRRSLVA